MALTKDIIFNKYIDEITIESGRRIDGLKKFDHRANYLWQESLKLLNSNDTQILNNAYKFAKRIKYNHPGLSSEVYFAHPLRVASLAIMLSDENPVEAGIVGLLHNIFEVSTTSCSELDQLFGKDITHIVKKLTVERTSEYKSFYKKKYYSDINSLTKNTRIVKAIDKFDNLFILSLNPDKEIRLKYLEEIKEYIVPIIKKDLPFMLDYFIDLIIYCEKS